MNFTSLSKLLKILLIAMFALVAFLSGGVNAQTPTAGVPQFMPIGSWRIEPTTLSEVRGLTTINLPCMMMNSYDNGYVVRLSGGGQKLLAMAIDFRQNVFTQGRKYNASVSFDGMGGQSLKGTAFSNNVLIFNLRNLGSFYQSIGAANMMEMDIDGNQMRFDVGGTGSALQRLETCYNPNANPNMSQAAAQTLDQTPRSPEMPANQPRRNNPKAWDNGKQEASAMAGSGMRTNGSQVSQIWEARAGADMRQTLESWSNRAGVALQWDAENMGNVASDIRVAGTFEDAVQNLMAQNAAAMGLEANLIGQGNARTLNSANPQSLLPTRMGGRSPRAGDAGLVGTGSAQWSAPAGSSLRQVLGIWSQKAGVDLIWQSNQNFIVNRGISANGSYESALQSLLEQFVGQGVRPAAQLNNDPATGRRTLFIEATRL